MRGPIEALHLSKQLADADRLSDADPAAAAREYTAIAEKLTQANWPGHALMLRTRAAETMAAAGERRAAGIQIAQLFWTYLDLGADSESQLLRHELRKLSQKTPDDESLRSLADAVGEAHNAVSDPLDRLDRLASAVDTLTPGTDAALEALTLLRELALTSEQPELILDRATRITGNPSPRGTFEPGTNRSRHDTYDSTTTQDSEHRSARPLRRGRQARLKAGLDGPFQPPPAANPDRQTSAHLR